VVGSRHLILTVTRACELRCAYCPTAKEGWPSLSAEHARLAVRLWAERYGGGDIKLFGGEPLLAPEAVRAALDAAAAEPSVGWVYLSTNGLGLSPAWLDELGAHPKLILTLSLDGRPEDHRRLRRGSPGHPDAYAHALELLPQLQALPRFVVTQTIAPSTAAAALENFLHLRGLGLWRFNLLPCYYLPWRQEQLAALARGFEQIGDHIAEAWAQGQRLYLRNLYVSAPTPFFNTGLVVDADGSIHPSNVGLSGQLDGLRGRTQVGSLQAPPSPELLAERALEVNGLLLETLPPAVWQSTLAVDRLLSRLCRRLLALRLRARRATLEAS
jgi:MoaA/NifB/PqqE/SkfB family radical SAM enzyme